MVTRPLDHSVAVIMMAIRRRLFLENVVLKMVKSVIIFGMSGVNGGEEPFRRDFSYSIHPLTFLYFFGEGIGKREVIFRRSFNFESTAKRSFHHGDTKATEKIVIAHGEKHLQISPFSSSVYSASPY